MSLAYGTAIQTPGGSRAIETLAAGDGVLAGSGQQGSWSWRGEAVEFSQGTGPHGEQRAMAYLRFGESGELIVTPDQLLMTDGGLQSAARLEPGTNLIAADGSAVRLDFLQLGNFMGGVHSIAMNVDDDGDRWDGHLLVCAGVIGGDFWLQMRQQEPWMAQLLVPAGPLSKQG